MVPLKMIRHRYVLADQVHSLSSVEIESQLQPILVQQQQQPIRQLGPSPLSFSSSSSSSPLPPISSSCATHSSFSSSVWQQTAQDFLWIASALFILYYGDFRSNFFSLVASDPRVWRIPLHIGLACLILDLCAFLYLAIELQSMQRIEERLDKIAPAAAVPAAITLGLSAFVLLSVALWPIWHVLTVPMLFTLFMAFVVVAPYVLPYMKAMFRPSTE